MKINKLVSFIIASVFLISTVFSTSSIQNTTVKAAEDRIIRVATTVWTNNGTKQQNLDSIDAFLADAAKNNPDIVVLSEGIYSIESSNWQPFFEAVPGPFTTAMSAKAIRYNTYIVANLYEDGLDGHRYNTSVLIDKQGNIVGKYRKMRLPPSEVAAPYSMTEGTEPMVFDTEFGKLAMEICYDIDIRFPEVTKMHADLGAELILVPSWGDYTHAAVQFARENNVFMVTAVRGQQWTDQYPHSAIISNDGVIINGIDNNSAFKTCYADINLTNKTWSVPDPKWNNVTPPPIRTSIPFASITASDSLVGREPQTLADGRIDNINAGPIRIKGWSSDKKEPSLIFDMGSLKKVGSIGIVQFDAFYQENYFKMFISQDGVDYVEYTKGLNYGSKLLRDYATGSSVSVKCYTTAMAPGYKYIEVNPPIDIRYIKIVGYGNKIYDNSNSTGSYKNTNLTEVTAFEPLNPLVTSAPFPTATPTITPIPTPTVTPTSTPTPTATPTATLTPTLIPTPTATPTPSPTVTPEPTPAYQFTDIPENHWAIDQIYSLAAKGIIAGYKNEDGTYIYKPDANIQRSEFIKILTCSFGVYDPDSTYDEFTDVKKGDWYYAYVASAVKEGLTVGITSSEFGSDLEMTREDLVTFIERALVKYKGYDTPTEEQINSSLSKFVDKDTVQSYAKPALALLVDNKVISGYIEGENTYFKPQNNATRAEVAIIADKSIKLEDQNEPTAAPTPVPTPPASTPTPTPASTPTPTPVSTPTPTPTLASTPT